MARAFKEMVIRPPTGGPTLRVMMNPETGEITSFINAAHYREFSPTIIGGGSTAVDGGWQKQATVAGVTTPLSYTASTDGHTGVILSLTGHSAAAYQCLSTSSGTSATTALRPLQLKKGVLAYFKLALPAKLITTSSNDIKIIAGLSTTALSDTAAWDSSTINMGIRINGANTPGSSALLWEMDDATTDTSIAVNDPATNAAFSLTTAAAPDFVWYNILINALDYRRPVLMVNNRAMQLPALPVLAELSNANGLVQPGFGIITDTTSGQSGSVVLSRILVAQATH